MFRAILDRRGQGVPNAAKRIVPAPAATAHAQINSVYDLHNG